MEITAEEIKKYQEDPLWAEWNKFHKEETKKLIEEEKRDKNRVPARILTEDKISILEKSLMADFTVEEACHQAWISISQFYNNYYQNEEFKTRINAARDFPFRIGKKKVMQAITSPDFNDYEFILKWLKLRQPKIYWEQQTIQFQWTETLNDEDKALLQEILIDKWDERTLEEIKKQEAEEQESEFAKQIDEFLSNAEDLDAFSWETDQNI